MDRRTFMKLLGGLASMPIVGKIAKPLKSETVQEGIAAISDKGMQLYEMVIAKVMKEGKKVGESGRVDSYKHPDRPDITVDVNQTDGSAEIYFDTDKGSKGYAKIDRDIETGATDLQEAEEVYRFYGPEGDYSKDIDEGISGGIENLEEFTRIKKAMGGRVGYQTGGQAYDPRASALDFARAIDMVGAGTDMQKARAVQEYGENVRNQALRAASLLSQPMKLTGPTTRLYSGTTSPTPFAGSKFFATPDLATAKTYATSSSLRGSPFAGPVTGRILEAEVPTAQAQSLLKKGLTGTREVVLDPQAAKTLFETGRGALQGSASLGTKAALSATKALPVIGGAASLADASSRVKEGDYVGAALGTAGAVPGLGLPALGAQVVYDAAKSNPTIQKVGTSIGEGLYNLLNPSKAEAATPIDRPTMADVAGPTTSTPEKTDLQKYKDKMLQDLRKNHPGQKTATTDLQRDGTHSGTVKEIPIEDYFAGMLAQVDLFPDAFGFDEKGQKIVYGGKDGGSVDLTIISMPDISGSGVESLFKRR